MEKLQGKKAGFSACSRAGLTNIFLGYLRVNPAISEKFIRKDIKKKSWAILILGGDLMANYEKMYFLINAAELIILPAEVCERWLGWGDRCVFSGNLAVTRSTSHRSHEHPHLPSHF